MREATREKGEKGETKPHALKPKGCDLIKQQRYTRTENIYGIYAVYRAEQQALYVAKLYNSNTHSKQNNFLSILSNSAFIFFQMTQLKNLSKTNKWLYTLYVYKFP